MYAVNPRDQAQIIGTVIDGRYEIMQCVGEGGMGVVYKARQKSIDRLVAIKMLSSTLAKDKSWVQRFYNEAKACSRLHHPNTIRMFDFGQTSDGQLFMAMEFLDGDSLRQVITRNAPMDPMRVLKILIQCCASLSEAHNLGIIHRDMKADNIFLIDLPGSTDHVKVLDFGVAKLMMAEDFATQVGVVFGTPQYMSPEQGRGEPLTPRSDLYGVGILAYEMLTGSVPFSDGNPMTVIQMHLQSPVPPLPPVVPGLVQTIVMRALEKDQKRRFASAAAMMEECQTALAVLSTGPFQVMSPAPHPIGTPGAGFVPLSASPGATTYPSGGPPPPVAAPPMHAQHSQAPLPGAAPMRGGVSPFDRPTVLDGHAPQLPPNVSPAAAAAAARKTVLVSSVEHMDMIHQPTPPPGPLPQMPLGGPNRTVMLPPSEGIVSMARAPTPPPMEALERNAYGGAAAGSSASALFWIFCLLAGLAVGVGAYWLVLELGK
jgi:eukaryotic-like serine/threonine-protein kinase